MDKKFVDAVKRGIKEEESIEQQIIKGAKERGWKSRTREEMLAATETNDLTKLAPTRGKNKPSRGV
jgi:hypothetical protein